MENITINDILIATNGVLLNGDVNKEIENISIDSRNVDKNTLFIPIVGEKVNAHKFIESVVNVGSATLTQEECIINPIGTYIKVSNTQKALQDIAVYYRNKINIPIVGVTGSVGKTTTREMIATALSAKYKVFKTEGNFNSQIGLPLTISKMKKLDEVAVLEMGMSERGQIEILTNIVNPNFAVVTCIGVAHIEQLKSKENICIEKLDIIKGFNQKGTLFLNGDDEFLVNYKNYIDKNIECDIVFYGTSEICDYRAKDIEFKNGRTYYILCVKNKEIKVELSVLGKHNVLNSLVGIAIAEKMGIAPEISSKEYINFKGLRQHILECGDYKIIDDTYNASPDSMKVSLNVLNDLETTGRKIAVLADMLELGENSLKYHYEIGEFLATKNIDEFIFKGENSKKIAEAVKNNNSKIKILEFKNNEEIIDYLKVNLKLGDLVLIKGSHGMALDEVVKALEV